MKDKNLNNNEKMKKTANILYENMKENKNHQIKGELYHLLELDNKNKIEKDYNKTADLLYPNTKTKLKKYTTNITNENKNKNILKILELNENKYEIINDTISPAKKKKEYEVINNVKYPIDTGNKKVEELLNKAKKERSEEYIKYKENFFKKDAARYKFGIDHSDNLLIKTGGKIRYNTETMENLEMSKTKSYMNTDYAKKHKIYNNYNETPDNFKNYFKEKITEQIGTDKLEKTKGIFIDANSKSSNSLKNNLLKDNNFIKKLKLYDSAMNNKYSINDSINIKGKWHNAIGNADIRDMRKNKNGDIELYVTDVYDFNEGEKNPLVQIGRNMQDKCEITPYFYMYRVIIPKAEKEKILKEYEKKGKNNE